MLTSETLRAPARTTAAILNLIQRAVTQTPTMTITDGLPTGSLLFEPAQLIAGGTPLTVPFFRDVMKRVANAQGADVLLARHGNYPELLDPTFWDLAVRLGHGVEVFTDFLLYVGPEQDYWLVPATTGPFARLAGDGITLEHEPPFITFHQRCAGVCEAAKQIIRATRAGMER